MFKKASRATSAGVLALGCTVMVGNSAIAQTDPSQPEADVGLEEVVVTAQKRSENVQDVPISITAIDGNRLQERAIVNVSQLSAIAPNVNLDSGVSFTASTAVLAASIRGIGASDFAFNIDPGTAPGTGREGSVFLRRSADARGRVPHPANGELTTLQGGRLALAPPL